MPLLTSRLTLTHDGATCLLDAALAHARAMGQPQCIAIVDAGCELLAYLRMPETRRASQIAED